MTAAVALRRHPAPTRRQTSSRPRLRVLDQAAVRRRARRRNALLLLLVMVVNGFFLVAFAHARLVENQQELDLVRAQIAELEAEKAQVERAVDEASSPARIVERATELGMVRAESPVYLLAVRDIGSG